MSDATVAPANVVRLPADHAEDAAHFIDYIARDLAGAMQSCDNLILLRPEFADAANLLRRKIITLHAEAKRLHSLAECGYAPAENS